MEDWIRHLIFVLCGQMIFWSLVTVFVKRLHDHNMSGWWCLFYILFLVVLTGKADTNADDRTGYNILIIISMIIGIWAFVKLGFLKGTDGSNKYGRDPVWAS